jgi:hypothetical protein
MSSRVRDDELRLIAYRSLLNAPNELLAAHILDGKLPELWPHVPLGDLTLFDGQLLVGEHDIDMDFSLCPICAERRVGVGDSSSSSSSSLGAGQTSRQEQQMLLLDDDEGRSASSLSAATSMLSAASKTAAASARIERSTCCDSAAVSEAQIETLTALCTQNRTLMKDVGFVVRSWRALAESVLDARARVSATAFAALDLLFDQIERPYANFSEAFADELESARELLAPAADVAVDVLLPCFEAVCAAFGRLRPDARRRGVRPLCALTLRMLELRSDRARAIEVVEVYLLPLLASLDATALLRAGRAVLRIGDVLGLEQGCCAEAANWVRPVVLQFVGALQRTCRAMVPPGVPSLFLREIVPALRHLPVDVYVEVLFSVLAVARRVTEIGERSMVLIELCYTLMERAIDSYEGNVGDVARQTAIDRFLQDRRVKDALTQRGDDLSPEVHQYRAELLVALITSFFHISSHPRAAAVEHPPRVAHALLDVGHRLFIGCVTTIHWSFRDATYPIEQYLKLFNHLCFSFFCRDLGSSALQSKFTAFIVGGIGSVNLLSVVPSPFVLCKLLFFLCKYSVQLRKFAQSSVATKAEQLPSKLFELLTEKIIAPSLSSSGAIDLLQHSELLATVLSILEILARDHHAMRAQVLATLGDIGRHSADARVREKCNALRTRYNSQKPLPTPSSAAAAAKLGGDDPLALPLNLGGGGKTSPSSSSSPSPSTIPTPLDLPSLDPNSTSPSPLLFRDKHYFFACKRLDSNMVDMHRVALATLTEQRARSVRQVLSGSSDPILVEATALSNAERRRLTLHLRLTNMTNMQLRDIVVVVAARGQLALSKGSRAENYKHIEVLGFRRHCTWALPLHVYGVCGNAVQVNISFAAKDINWPNVGAPLIACKPYVPALSRFLHCVKLHASEFVVMWNRLPAACQFDGELMPPVDLDQLCHQIVETTAFRLAIDIDHRQDQRATYRQLGYASLSWFADQLAIMLVGYWHVERARWLVRVHIRASSARLARSFRASIIAWLQERLQGGVQLLDGSQDRVAFGILEQAPSTPRIIAAEDAEGSWAAAVASPRRQPSK